MTRTDFSIIMEHSYTLGEPTFYSFGNVQIGKKCEAEDQARVSVAGGGGERSGGELWPQAKPVWG